MMNFIRILIVLSLFSSNLSYADELDNKLEMIDNENVDYNQYSIKSSSKGNSEIEENEEYNININDCVSVNYKSSKITKETK